MNRRTFLRSTGLATAAAVVGWRQTAQAEPKINVLETKVISHEPQYYHGWPTLARRRNGDLLVTCSGGRQAHVCPFGRVELMTSHDDGGNWSWPQIVLDSPIDDRDSGVLETAKGSLLITTFTSLAYERILQAQRRKKPGEAGAWSAEVLEAWSAANDRLTPEQRRAELGQWMIRSTDGGLSWSARYPTIVNSPHGPIQLSDGRLLYAGKELWTLGERVGVCESLDDGQSWHWLASIPTRQGDTGSQYHELHGVETTDGRIVVHIRNENKANSGDILQTESTDGGKSWSVPRLIGVWGHEPSFLTRLRSGRLLMTYGYRRKPFGNQSRFSDDGGSTWSEPVIISGDGPGVDLGYPSTAELADGSLLTVWYELMKGENRALRQARWRLEA